MRPANQLNTPTSAAKNKHVWFFTAILIQISIRRRTSRKLPVANGQRAMGAIYQSKGFTPSFSSRVD